MQRNPEKGYSQKRMRQSAPQIAREKIINPECRAWLAATAMTLSRPGLGEELNIELPTPLRTQVTVRAEKTELAGHSTCASRVTPFFATPGHRAPKE